MSVMCKHCKHAMEEKKGTFSHRMFGREIFVLDVPYYVCSNCEHQFYVSDKKVEQKLKQAYALNIHEITYE